MTNEDLDRVEAALQLTLPSEYRAALTGRAVPAETGNDWGYLVDDAKQLIGLNEDARRNVISGCGG